MVVPVDPVAHVVISVWARLSSFISVPDISLDSSICGAHDFYVGLSCEVWRGAIGAVETGQWEAGDALNLRYVCHVAANHHSAGDQVRTGANDWIPCPDYQRNLARLHNRVSRFDVGR